MNNYIFKATLSRVIDGDTYELDIDLGFKVHVTLPCRLRGIDVYEHNTPQGIEATHYVRNLLTGKTLTVMSYKDHQSFARWIVDIWVDDKTVAGQLRTAGFEKPTAA